MEGASEGIWWLEKGLFKYIEQSSDGPNKGVEMPGIILPATSPEKNIMLMDQGEGNGFVVGYEYPASGIAPADIEGRYKFIGIAAGDPQQTVLGNYILRFGEDGSTDYWLPSSDDRGQQRLINFKRFDKVNNLFFAQIPKGYGDKTIDVYIAALSGVDKILMTFSFVHDEGAGVQSMTVGAVIQ